MGSHGRWKIQGLPVPRRPISDSLQVMESRLDWQSAGISSVLHLSFFLVLALLWQPIRNGSGNFANQPIGISAPELASNDQQFDVSDSTGSSSDDGNGGSPIVGSLPSGNSGSVLSADQLLEGLVPSGNGDRGSGAGELVGSVGLGTGGADVGGGGGIPKAKTSVFGISGTGSRFVYVFDRSDSMNGYGGAPLAAAKRELTESLKSFGPVHQFQIVFYNDAPSLFRMSGSVRPSMVFGEPSVKSEAVEFVKRTIAIGGTEHAAALKRGLSLGPDVIFFLTDANLPALTQRQIAEIAGRAVRSGTTIHTIEFGVGPTVHSEGWIAQLASETGGEYRYVNVQELASGVR